MKLIEIEKYPVQAVFGKLLCDKTTGKNIIYATNHYSIYGCSDSDQMTLNDLLGFDSLEIQPRVLKSQTQQSARTHQNGEVFTPMEIVRKMTSPLEADTDWQTLVTRRTLEIACGEAPFLVTRYDTTTGEPVAIPDRVGVLDQKLRAISQNVDDEATWLKWAYKAYENTYGYELQGDNLLIARINLLVTFCDYLADQFSRQATEKELGKLTNIITWNIFQMDGLKDTMPLGVAGEKFHQFSFFDEPDTTPQADDTKIYDFRARKSVLFRDIKEGETTMKFDFVIGNPPYQDETTGDQKNFAPPVYHLFMDAAYQVSDKVELITPARFLFNAGSTPKDWNKKMLSDPHFKVLFHEQDSSKVFKDTDIKGGVVITYRDAEKDFGAIETFIVFPELKSIVNKAKATEKRNLSQIIYAPESYKFTDEMHKDFPEIEGMLSKGHKYDFKSNVIEKLSDIVFFDEKKTDDEYVQIWGLIKGKRVVKWIKRKYIREAENFENYKVFLPESNGSGAIGEVLSTPLVGTPLVGHTQTFISIGNYETYEEANALFKYIKTKFCRALLGSLKITQHNSSSSWKNVILQDFTENSDIDWSQSVAEIDRQLYAKYGLDETEIDFIESHVKEMA